MIRLIRVVVSCTERKSVPPLPSLRASKLTRESFELRVAMWLERISEAPRTVRAVDLYQGEHWAVARTLVESSAAEVWVASAGYGLVNAHECLAAYGATFGTRQSDSVTLSNAVATLNEERSIWWQALQHPVGGDYAVSLASLAADGPLIVAASRPYLAAMEKDLRLAALLAEGRVVVATTGRVPAGIRHLRTPGTGKLRTVLGGSMQAVSIRLAAEIVESISEAAFTHDAVTEFTTRLMAKAAPLERFSRSPLSDDEVSAFVANAFRTDSPPSCSALLRVMRDTGMACEQSRFRGLYLAVRGNFEPTN